MTSITLGSTVLQGVAARALWIIGGTGIGAAVMILRGDSSWTVPLGGVFGAALGGLAAEDLRSHQLPNRITYTGTAVALSASALAGNAALLSSAGGAVMSAGIMGALFLLGRGRLGLGDVKLSTFVGSVVGVVGVPLFLLAGTAAGTVGALALLLAGRSRTESVAYGPFLVVGALVALAAKGLAVAP